ncbi:MAG: hypothetical protein OEY88_06910 [Candidatus Bathyarchaeota archaeon]|nr:hypothetical protein [Candidatus Bathyarchaeota archaeon]
MSLSKQGSTKLLRISEILYMLLAVLSFYLLIASRTGEARTVWQVLHPAFIPTLFVTTSLLLTILFSSEKTTHKMLLIIVHSILLHSFFPIIFPAGDLSGQQTVLGQTRRVFDNTILHGLSGWPTRTLQIFIVEMFRGTNLQAALSTIFARMLSIDIFHVHLFLVPVLWGTFVPVASFLTTKALGGDDKASVLSSLLVSAFPYPTYFGAISVPNSLGFIFFFYSLYFMLKHLSSNNSRTAYFMVAFSFFSFLAHSLTGIISFSLLLLALAFKSYKSEKAPSSITSKASLAISFLFCVSLLPLSFIYLRFLNPAYHTIFTLDKFYELPPEEIAGLFLIGELTYGFDPKTILLVITGSTFALLYMIYLLHKLKKNSTTEFRIHFSFLFASFLIILIDYRILKLFMDGLPLNEERLWVFRDFIAVPFVALAIYAVISPIKAFLKAKSPPTITITSLKTLSKSNVLRVITLLSTLNVLIPAVLGGWITFSLSAAYPQVAPLQTTWYELEAVKYIEENTQEKYVVIGDVWTIYAGEMIVGIYNPQAYYFGEQDSRGISLFTEMRRDPSPQVMIEAMNQTGTDTTVAYFIVTEPRLGVEEFNSTVSKTLQNGLPVYATFGNEKLYIFYYEK